MTAVHSLVLIFAAIFSNPDCTCTQAKKENGWCKECKVGFVATIPVKSWKLFETLDAHGHDIDIKSVRCATCKKAIETDGFCKKCKMGFVKKQAYLSRLTYFIARGEIREKSKIVCKQCRENANDHGWCDACKVGMVGKLALKKKEDFAEAHKAFQRLHAALNKLEKCEICAVAIFADGRCRFCKISYKNGKRINTK